ncbi:MAG TPA: hypothetical protein VLT91_10645, partial [Rhizomicrobium sp.]|nr:hypothetical protein [Rhizomicrobium sp.]
RMLGQPRAVAERGFALVAGPGVNPIQRHHMGTLGTETGSFQQHFLAVAMRPPVAMIRPEFHGKPSHAR